MHTCIRSVRCVLRRRLRRRVPVSLVLVYVVSVSVCECVWALCKFGRVPLPLHTHGRIPLPLHAHTSHTHKHTHTHVPLRPRLIANFGTVDSVNKLTLRSARILVEFHPERPPTAVGHPPLGTQKAILGVDPTIHECRGTHRLPPTIWHLKKNQCPKYIYCYIKKKSIYNIY